MGSHLGEDDDEKLRSIAEATLWVMMLAGEMDSGGKRKAAGILTTLLKYSPDASGSGSHKKTREEVARWRVNKGVKTLSDERNLGTREARPHRLAQACPQDHRPHGPRRLLAMSPEGAKQFRYMSSRKRAPRKDKGETRADATAQANASQPFCQGRSDGDIHSCKASNVPRVPVVHIHLSKEGWVLSHVVCCVHQQGFIVFLVLLQSIQGLSHLSKPGNQKILRPVAKDI